VPLFSKIQTSTTYVKELNNTVGEGNWYDTFQVWNTNWLWLANDIVAVTNNDKTLVRLDYILFMWMQS
jgi:hypothetical protein